MVGRCANGAARADPRRYSSPDQLHGPATHGPIESSKRSCSSMRVAELCRLPRSPPQILILHFESRVAAAAGRPPSKARRRRRRAAGPGDAVGAVSRARYAGTTLETGPVVRFGAGGADAVASRARHDASCRSAVADMGASAAHLYLWSFSRPGLRSLRLILQPSSHR
jgi:hypothetical protein